MNSAHQMSSEDAIKSVAYTDDDESGMTEESSSTTSSSILSLHIASYPSDDSSNDTYGKFSKQQCFTEFSDREFEFPRQQQDQETEPEVSKFKGGQKSLEKNERQLHQPVKHSNNNTTDTGEGDRTSTDQSATNTTTNLKGDGETYGGGGTKSFEANIKRKSRLFSLGSKSKGDDPEVAERKKRQTKKRTKDLIRMEAHDQLSCVNPDDKRRTRTRRTMAGPGLVPEPAEEEAAAGAIDEAKDGDKHALANHLRSIAPFNKRWKVTQTINEGTYGVVFAVQDVETGVHGVIKVAKSVGNDAGNQTAEWEGFILEKMYKQNPNGSIVRLLDKGMLADQNGEGMEFMVLEKAEIPVMDYVKGVKGIERKWRVANVMLQMLKGIYDMHREGLLHRDLKPDNMGILAKKQPVVVLFDLGMVRMYTGFFGEHRQPRTVCAFRGTPEWASGYAQKGRDQNRFDDLIGWLYVAVELFDETENAMQPLPWTFRQNPKIVKYLKSPFCPAYLLLNRCPPQFYAINTYLMTTSRKSTPDYRFIANKVLEAIADIESQMSKIPSSIISSSAAGGKEDPKPTGATAALIAARTTGTTGTTRTTTGGAGPASGDGKKSKVSSAENQPAAAGKRRIASDDFLKSAPPIQPQQKAPPSKHHTKEINTTTVSKTKEQSKEERKSGKSNDKNGNSLAGAPGIVEEEKGAAAAGEKKEKSANAIPSKSLKSTPSNNKP